MPQEFRIPLKPKKSKMPKNLKIPLDASRRTSGRFYNQMNDKNKAGGDQRALNNVSNRSGHTLTPEGIKRPVGWVHTWGTLLTMAPSLDFPDQQMVLKKTPSAFEVNTWIDVRRDGNQTRIHSFVSTSAINREQIQPPLFLNTTHTRTHPSSSIALPFASVSSLFGDQTLHNRTSTSTQQDIDVAKMAHELSISVHQKVHELYQLVNCSTTRRTDQMNTWIVTGESVEQTRFTTICQDAVGQAERQNNQGMKQESENAIFSSHHMTNTSDHEFHPFSAEEAARKLSKTFQDSFENKHNATIDIPNHIHNQVTEPFWNGLTEQLYQFFSQHKNTTSTQEQEGVHGESLMTYFVDLLLQTFSVNYGKQAPTNTLSEKNLNYQVKSPSSNTAIQTKKKPPEVTTETISDPVLETTPETMMKENESVLNPEKEGFFPQVWQLATDFYGVVDGFLQQSIGLQFLGTEAMPLPTNRIPSLESEVDQLTFNETQISETTAGNNQVNGTRPYAEEPELEMMPSRESDAPQEIGGKVQILLRENVDDPTKTVVQEEQELLLPEWTRFQFLDAEAMPLPTNRIPSLESEVDQLTFNETQISETTAGNNQVNGTRPYAEEPELEMTSARKSEVTQDINEKIQAFLQENADDPTKTVIQEEQELPLPEWTSEQKENIRKKLVDFFTEKGIVCQDSNAKELIDTIDEWVLLEGATPPALDMVKVKQLAKLFLGMGEEEVVSEEQASLTVGSWIYEIMKDNQPDILAIVVETTEQAEGTSTPPSTISPQPTSTDKQKSNIETDDIQWRDPNVRQQVETFLQQKKLITEQSTKEEVLIAMGKWITKKEDHKLFLDYENLRPVAKVILKELKLYGGKKEENISNKDAELTVMKWAFETILGSSLEAYMVKKLVSAPDIDQFTMGHLRELFTVKNLEKEGLIQLEDATLTHKQKNFFNKLWNLFLHQELPNYFLDNSGLADDLLISDYASLMQLTGAKILKEGEYQHSFSQEEARLMGEHFWQTILEKGINDYEELRSLLMPSLLAIAQLEPELLREELAKGTYKEVAIGTFIGYQQEGYFKLVEHQELFDRLYKAYQEALIQWRRKDAIATNVAKMCRTKGSSKLFYVIKQNYLLGSTPCSDIKWVPPKLEAEYTKLTKNVSEAHVPFDKKLIEFALNALEQKELDFIFSKTTTLYEGFAELKNEHDYKGGAPGTGGMILVNVKGRVPWEDTILSLDKTDLFVAVQGNEERWYALKRLDEEGGYIIYRVDQDPLAYLKYGLFNRKDLWGGGYRQVRNETRIGNKYFKFSASVNRSKQLSHGEEIEPFLETFSRKHSDQLYNQLYDSGNDKADIKKAWDVIKHFIPFYDCVVGIKNQDVGEAVTSCTIDALLFIPVVGQITSLNMKFALGVARALARGGIRSIVKSSRHFLPKVTEIRKLVYSLARTIDPGFETIAGGGRLVIQKVLKFKNEFQVGAKTKALLEKIEVMEKAREALKKEIVLGKLNGLEVPVKKMNADLYMKVTNLDTADVFGGLYMLKGFQLEPYRGPAKFTTEQLKLIDQLAVQLDEDQVHIVEVNLDPQAYGEGMITTVTKEGEETKRFIRMKEKLIPVRIQSIEEHGVRMYVKDPSAKKFLPVNYNGVEWYFEPPTSRSVSKEVETKIGELLDQFETQKNPIFLSGPDSKHGLMWNGSNRSYIKIKEHYIPLVLLDENLNRYHLVKKDYNEAMTVLRFNEKKGQFRFETEWERQQAIEAATLSPGLVRSRGGLGKKRLKMSEEGSPSTSQGVASQMTKDVVLPPANQLPPNPPRHAEEWTKLRKAISIQEKYKAPVPEDDSIQLGDFSTFLPENTIIYYDDDEWLEGQFMKGIRKDLPSEPKLDFRVYVGLKSEEVPEYIKLFKKKLVENFIKSQGNCKTAKEKCDKLLKEGVLAETTEGQYLIDMFKLKDAPNQEEILKEIISRLRSIAKKGEEFLQKTADLGFQNIWIVSTDLVRQPGTQEYRSLYKKTLRSEAFVVTADPECRMIIYADAFHLDPDIRKGKQIIPDARETILHEMTHHAADTEDVVRYYRVEAGFSKSAQDTIDDFTFNYPNLLKSKPFKRFVKHLANSLDKPTISIATVAEEMKENFMLRANFQMMDAEMVMTLLRDFAEGRAFKERPIIKRDMNEENLKMESMFTYLVYLHILGEESFEKDIQLNKEQEQTIMETTDDVSVNITNKEVTETVEITKETVNRSALNLVADTEAVIGIAPSVSDQPVDTEPLKNTAKQGFLDLVVTSVEKSIKKNSDSTQINQNQQELRLQH